MPFRLMFGRDFNLVYLFWASNIEVEECSSSEDEAIFESETYENIYEPSINANHWIEDMDSCRISECEVARENIIQDQARQKRIFDAKVQRNRY